MDNFINKEMAKEFLAQIDAGRTWVVASMDAVDKPHMRAVTIGADQLDAWLENNKNANCYFTLNQSAVIGRKPKAKEITKIVGFYVDIDPQNEGTGDALYEERAEILRRLNNYDPAPSLIIDSGNGYQAIWLLEKPIPIGEEQGQITSTDASLINMALAEDLGGDSVQNIDRLLRLPGTANVPNPRKREKGRIITRSTYIAVNRPNRYTLADFRQSDRVILDEAEISTTPISTAARVQLGRLRAQYPHLHEKYWETVLHKQPLNYTERPDGKNSRSDHLQRCLWAMMRAGIPNEVIKSILLDKDFPISENVYYQNRTTQRPPEQQADRWIHYCRAFVDKIAAMDATSRFREENGRDTSAHSLEMAQQECMEDCQKWMRYMNEHYSVLKRYHGHCSILYNKEADMKVVRRGSLNDAYCNKKVKTAAFTNDDGQVVIMEAPLAKWWFEHENRRQYEKAEFAPGEDLPDDVLNTFTGFAIEPVAGNCENFLEHLRTIICREDEPTYNYLIQWMASSVQNLGQVAGNAVVMQGKKGTGKGTVCRMMEKIFGRHFMQITNLEHSFGKFNSHLADKCMIFLDEAFWAASSGKYDGILKGLVTEKNIIVEPKGFQAESHRNCLNIMIASNNDFVVPATADERRFFILETSPLLSDVRQTDPEAARTYFDVLYDEMDNGGAEAFLDFLLQVDLSTYNRYAPPKNMALHRQVQHNLLPKERWFQEVLQQGAWFPDVEKFNKEPCALEIQESFQEWKSRNHAPYENTYFHQFFENVVPGIKKTQREVTYIMREYKNIEDGDYAITKRRNVYLFPDLETCRKIWMKKYPAANLIQKEDDKNEDAQMNISFGEE